MYADTFSMDMIDLYLEEMEQAVRSIDRHAVRTVVDVLFDCWSRRGTVYLAGNGGSAATASHMVCDLMRCTLVAGRARVRAVALSDNIPSLTAIANDIAYEDVFVEPLRALLDPGDVVLAISGSGNSPNVLRAIEYARAAGNSTIGLCGDTGGILATLVDVAVKVPAARIGQQEDGHLILNHAISLALRERIAATLPAASLVGV